MTDETIEAHARLTVPGYNLLSVADMYTDRLAELGYTDEANAIGEFATGLNTLLKDVDAALIDNDLAYLASACESGAGGAV